MKQISKLLLLLVPCATLVSLVLHARGQDKQAAAAGNSKPSSLSINLNDLHWVKMEPSMGDASPVRAMLHENPRTHSAQFVIRMPPGFHVPLHWHNANETHTILEGKFIMEASGKRVTLTPGGFNYTPAHVPHEAWTTDEPALLFVTIDGPYDIQIGSPARSVGSSRAHRSAGQ